jgi:hypothetical protein
MWNGLQGGLQNGMMQQQQQQQQQGNRCLQQNGAIQQQSGPYATQHLPGHLSQNGIQNRPPQQEAFSGGGNSVTMLHESQTLVRTCFSWLPTNPLINLYQVPTL